MTERGAQLLATMTERIGDQSQERLLRERRKRRTWPGPQHNHGRLDAGRWPERTRRNSPHDPRFRERLREYREVAALARITGRRRHPSRHLALDEHDDERRASVVG